MGLFESNFFKIFGAVFATAFTLSACGGGGSSGNATSVTPPPSPLPPSNQSPTISETSFAFDEGVDISFELDVSDTDGDTVTVTLDDSGDGRFFELDGSNLVINGRPTGGEFDFENPLDGDSNNVYEIGITLSDGTDSVSETLSIEINDVEGPLTCSSGETVQLPENYKGPIYSFITEKPDRRADEIDFDIQMVITRPGASELRQDFGWSMTLNFPSSNLVAGRDLVAFDYLNAEYEGDLNDPYKVELGASSGNETVTCSVDVQIVDIENEIESGVKFSGSYPENSRVGMADIGDIDQDGLADVWIMSGETINDSPPLSKGYLVFGSAVQSALADDGKEEFLIDRFTPDQAVEITSFFESVRPDNEFDGNDLVAERVGDIDGDGLPELLLTLSTSITSRSNAFDDRPLAYILWGAALTSDVDGKIDLQNLSADEGFILEGLGGIDRKGNTSTSGDFDGDGIDDILIGIPGGEIQATETSRYRGTTFLVFGDYIRSIKSAGRVDLLDDIATLKADEVMLLTVEDEDDTIDSPPESPLLSGAGGYMLAMNDISGDGADELVLLSGSNEQNITRLVVIDSAALIAAKAGSGLFEYTDILANQLDIIRSRGDAFSGDRSGDFDGDGIDDVIFIKEDLFQETELAALIRGTVLQDNGDASLIDVESDTDNGNAIHFKGGYQPLGASFIGDLDADGLDDLYVSYDGIITIVLGKSLTSLTEGGVVQLDNLEAGNGINLINATPEQEGALLWTLDDVDGDGIIDYGVTVETFPDKEGFVVLGSDLLEAINSGGLNFDLTAKFRASSE